MRNNPLPKDFATNLMPAGDDGKFVLNVNNLQMYIEAVVQYLQDNRQSLSTADFVDFLFASLGITKDDGDLASALFLTLTTDHVNDIDDYMVLYHVITAWLAEQRFDNPIFSRYLCILKADYPMPSTLNPKKIAVWRNTSKMGDWDKRQAVSVRKWIGSTFKEFTDDQAESLAKRIDDILKPLDDLDVLHHDSYDFAAWERAYVNDAIISCMNPNHTDCEVGCKHTFTCYCSGYHGLPDNGLKLTVLYQDGNPVARAITFTHHEQDYYIRVYGDDRLRKWLDDNGYKQSDLKAGTILYTTEGLLKPYVDGDVHMADHCTTSDGKHYWKLCTDGEYDLQTTDAYASYPTTCDCCSNSYHTNEMREICSAVTGRYYIVCDNCYAEDSYYVYTGGREAERLFFHDGLAPDTNSGYVKYDGEYYETEQLHEYSLRLIDDKVYHKDDLYYCEFECEYFTRDEVYTDADEISTDQPVHFPYDRVSKEYWDENVVECACGTLALSGDTGEISTPSLGSVITLDDYWTIYTRRDGAGVQHTGIIFKLDDIECAYDYDPSEEMQAFRDYAIAYNTIQYLRFQELGI